MQKLNWRDSMQSTNTSSKTHVQNPDGSWSRTEEYYSANYSLKSGMLPPAMRGLDTSTFSISKDKEILAVVKKVEEYLVNGKLPQFNLVMVGGGFKALAAIAQIMRTGLKYDFSAQFVDNAMMLEQYFENQSMRKNYDEDILALRLKSCRNNKNTSYIVHDVIEYRVLYKKYNILTIDSLERFETSYSESLRDFIYDKSIFKMFYLK